MGKIDTAFAVFICCKMDAKTYKTLTLQQNHINQLCMPCFQLRSSELVVHDEVEQSVNRLSRRRQSKACPQAKVAVKKNS